MIIGRCYDVTRVNAYAPAEDKIDDTKVGSYEDLAHTALLLPTGSMADHNLRQLVPSGKRGNFRYLGMTEKIEIFFIINLR
jgi:hypothetical protein